MTRTTDGLRDWLEMLVGKMPGGGEQKSAGTSTVKRKSPQFLESLVGDRKVHLYRVHWEIPISFLV